MKIMTSGVTEIIDPQLARIGCKAIRQQCRHGFCGDKARSYI